MPDVAREINENGLIARRYSYRYRQLSVIYDLAPRHYNRTPVCLKDLPFLFILELELLQEQSILTIKQ